MRCTWYKLERIRTERPRLAKPGSHRTTANELPPGSTYHLLFAIAGTAAFYPFKSVAVASSLHRPCSRAQEMCGFFQDQGSPSDLLRKILRKISSINRHDTTYSHREENTQAGREPLVLTYHPLNEIIKKILLYNCQILNNDPRTGLIFTQGALVAYLLDHNITNVFFHTTAGSQSADPAATVPCKHPICCTCQHRRSFQLPFQQLSLLHLVPSLPFSLHRGNRSKTRRTFQRKP